MLMLLVIREHQYSVEDTGLRQTYPRSSFGNNNLPGSVLRDEVWSVRGDSAVVILCISFFLFAHRSWQKDALVGRSSGPDARVGI